MTIGEFQELMARTYLGRDGRRGIHATFSWLVEEVGELSRALREKDPEAIREEMADVLAWLCSLANLAGVDLEKAASKYAGGCPRCSSSPCSCPEDAADNLLSRP
jgi:NTP pyrophosphatase (non-canonical NTP hydrolase)